MREYIDEAWRFLREKNHTIPDDVIDYLRHVAHSYPKLSNSLEAKDKELAEYRDIMSPADIHHRFEILIKLYNLLGADDVQAVDRLEETLKENADLKERLEEFESDLANSVNGGASCRMHEATMRRKHYSECQDIAWMNSDYETADAIERAREEGK